MSNSDVRLIVLTSDVEKVKLFIKELTNQIPLYLNTIDECPTGRSCYVTEINFDDIHNANLNIEDELLLARIPYTKKWSASTEYTQGEAHLRFGNDNTPVLKTFDDIKDKYAVDFEALKECYALGESYVQQLIDTVEEANYIIAWADQKDILQLNTPINNTSN